MEFRVDDWRALRKGKLHGFATVTFGGLLTVRDIAVFGGRNGLFAGFPRKSWEGKAGTKYADIVSIEDRGRAQAFSDALVKRLQEKWGLGQGSGDQTEFGDSDGWAA